MQPGGHRFDPGQLHQIFCFGNWKVAIEVCGLAGMGEGRGDWAACSSLLVYRSSMVSEDEEAVDLDGCRDWLSADLLSGNAFCVRICVSLMLGVMRQPIPYHGS